MYVLICHDKPIKSVSLQNFIIKSSLDKDVSGKVHHYVVDSF